MKNVDTPVLMEVSAKDGPVSDDEKAFLAAVVEAPDDDTTRLVYADWLQENGQEQEAEFIRLCLQGEELDDAQRYRHRELYYSLLKIWNDRLEHHHIPEFGISFDRGGLPIVKMQVKDFVRCADRMFDVCPQVVGLNVWDIKGNIRQLNTLLASRHLHRLTYISLANQKIGPHRCISCRRLAAVPALHAPGS